MYTHNSKKKHNHSKNVTDVEESSVETNKSNEETNKSNKRKRESGTAIKRTFVGINEASEESNIKICQHAIESEVYFAPPEKDRVLKVINTERTLELSDVDVIENAVFVGGHIQKAIMYKTIKAEDQKNSNKEKDENKEDKKNEEKKEEEKLAVKINELNPVAVDGVVRHTTAWIPFRCYIPIEGAQIGDACEIISAELLDNGSISKSINYEEADMSAENDTAAYVLPYIQGIMDTDVIKFAVKITKQ